ncbi:MAG: hypothetical protein AB1529_00805 [Candidatus Micrarchaeota archaeon]
MMSILMHVLSMRREEWMDRDSLEEAQKNKLEGILRCAGDTGYYSRHLGIVPAADAARDLSLLPVLEKDRIRSDPLLFIRRGADMRSLDAHRTSGTTGIPITIYTDRAESLQRIAIVHFHEISQGRSPFGLFADISRESYAPHSFVLFRKLKIDSREPEEAIYEKIARNRPEMIKGYPSILAMLARMNKKIRPKSIIACGETLTPGARKLIGDSFSCPVLDYYGAWEFRSVAWECPEEGRMHVNSSTLKVEIVDHKGRPKKHGKGNIVVTSLYNRTMPLIRYGLGDTGSWGKDCPCGRGYPVLGSFEGRNPVLIRLPSGKTHPAISLGILDIDAAVSEITQYQIIQEREDLFVLRYCGSELTERTKDEITADMRKACLGEEIRLEFEHVERIPRGRTGKIERVVSKVR